MIFLLLNPTFIITCPYFKIIKEITSVFGPFLFLLVVIADYLLTVVQQKLIHDLDNRMNQSIMKNNENKGQGKSKNEIEEPLQS